MSQSNDALPWEQRSTLSSLLDELSTNTTSDLILRCQEVIGFDPKNESDREQMDLAFAGAWGFNRALMYLDRLRTLNDERKQIGKRITALKRRAAQGARSDEEVKEVALAHVLPPILSGQQEVVLNFFCVSVQHIRSLLMITAESVGYEIPPEDLAFLDEFRHLRNHFEHWYSRLPGGDSEAAMMTRTVTDDTYQVSGGLRTDKKGRYLVMEPKKGGVLIEHTVEVTDHGIGEVQRIFEETTTKVRENAIDKMRSCWIADPDTMPSLESIRRVGFMRATRYGE